MENSWDMVTDDNGEILWTGSEPAGRYDTLVHIVQCMSLQYPSWIVTESFTGDETYSTFAAHARAKFIQIATSSDEILVKYAYESLGDCQVFRIEDQSGCIMWVVNYSEASKGKSTHAGGCEIHLQPTIGPRRAVSIPS